MCRVRTKSPHRSRYLSATVRADHLRLLVRNIIVFIWPCISTTAVTRRSVPLYFDAVDFFAGTTISSASICVFFSPVAAAGSMSRFTTSIFMFRFWRVTNHTPRASRPFMNPKSV